MKHSEWLRLQSEGDIVVASLRAQSESVGISISELILIALERQSGLTYQHKTVTEKESARQRFRRHAGAIDLTY